MRVHREEAGPRQGPGEGAREHHFGVGHKRIRAWDVPSRASEQGDATDEPTFVLVHGLGVSSYLFGEVTDRLRSLGRVVVFDLPGFGGVPHPRDPMSIAEFAALIPPSMTTLGVENPVLVGHSMGAQVVVEVARTHPDLRGAMVLVAPVVRGDQRTLPRVLVQFARSSRHERFVAALASVRGYLSAGLRWPLEILPSMLRYPIEQRIAGLGGRLMIVRGEFDHLCTPGFAEGLLRSSGAQGGVIVAADAAHQVVVNNADEVVSAAVVASGRGPLP